MSGLLVTFPFAGTQQLDPHNLKEEGFNLACGFKGIPSLVNWLQSRNFVAEGHGRPKMLSSWRPGSRTGKSATEEGVMGHT